VNNKTNSKRYETRNGHDQCNSTTLCRLENVIKVTVLVLAGYVLHFWCYKSIRVVVRVVVDDADKVREMAIIFVTKDQTSRRSRHEGVVHARRG